jgi:hypothetical protein
MIDKHEMPMRVAADTGDYLGHSPYGKSGQAI